MSIVDFHSHFFSRAFFETLAAASPMAGKSAERMEAVMQSAGLTLPPSNSVEHWNTWRAELDRYGVDHIVTFASVPQEVDDVAAAITASEGRASGFAIVDPTQAGAAARTDELLGQLGFKGVLMFPAMHHFDPSGPEADEVFRVVAEHAAVATVHCGLLSISLRDRFGLPRAYDLTLANPLKLTQAADRHLDANFVLPHFGGGYFRETLMAGAQCGNIHVDTSSSNNWMRTNPGHITFIEVLERALSVFGADRILFGTDSSVFPRGWRNDLLTLQRESIGAVGGNGEQMTKILGGNARRLLRLEQSSGRRTAELGTDQSAQHAPH